MRKRSIRFPALLLLPLAAALALLLLPRLRPHSVAAPRHELRETEGGGLGYYIDGVLQERFTGIVQDSASGRWYYASDGLVDGTYTGFASNTLGWWYIESGTVDFSRCALIHGVVNGEENDWYVLGGMVKTDYTGASSLPGTQRQYMIRGGRLDRDYTGFSQRADGWWYASEGCISGDVQGIFAGLVNGTDGLWYVSGSKVQLDCRGLVTLSEEERWCVNGGRVEMEKTGIFLDGEEAWFCREGRVDTAARCAWTEADSGDWIVLSGRARPVRSEEDKTLFRALQFRAQVVQPGMTQEEELRACYEAVKACREMQPRYPHLRTMDWPSVYANDIFDNGAGNCFSFAAAFAYLAKAVGYEEVYVCNSGGHGWAEIDGKIYDPEWARSRPNYDLFGLSYDTALGSTYYKVIRVYSSPGNEWMRVLI